MGMLKVQSLGAFRFFIAWMICSNNAFAYQALWAGTGQAPSFGPKNTSWSKKFDLGRRTWRLNFPDNPAYHKMNRHKFCRHRSSTGRLPADRTLFATVVGSTSNATNENVCSKSRLRGKCDTLLNLIAFVTHALRSKGLHRIL
jgi:hypothetical protein